MTSAIQNSFSTPVRLLICGLAFIAAATPMALQQNLLLTDYPEHLAHFYLRYNLPQSPELQHFYTFSQGYYPYWGIRLAVAALEPFLGLEQAVKWFAIIAALMPAAGACALGWTFAGRITLLPLLSLFFVHNAIFSWGFINYLFCGGLALFVFAAWVASRDKPFVLRWLAIALAALCLIWAHPFSAVLLGAVICLWELARTFAAQANIKGARDGLVNATLIGTAFVPAGLSLLALTNFRTDMFPDNYGGIVDRVMAMYSPFWLQQSMTLLLLSIVSVFLLGVLLLNRHLVMRAGMGLLFVLMVLLALATPLAHSGVYFLNVRIPTFAMMVFCAGLATGSTFSRWRIQLFAAFLILFLGKILAAYSDFHSRNLAVTEFRTASRHIAEQSKVLMAIKESAGPEGIHAKRVFINMDSYLIVDRHVLVPNIFGSVGIAYNPEFLQQTKYLGKPAPLHLLDQKWEDWTRLEQAFWPFARNWAQQFDYIILIDTESNTPPPTGTRLIHRGSFFSIFSIS